MSNSKQAAQDADQVTPSTAEHIRRLAAQHGVVYTPTGLDSWAAVVTELAGDTIRPDPTQDLLLALRRANVISAQEMASLLTTHLREVKAGQEQRRHNAGRTLLP